MKICGFTFVRNAVKFDYPIVESVKSLLPLVDEIIVLVGKSEDGTLELIRSIPSDKIKIHESVWDESLKEGGRVLAVETDKAFALVPKDYDWAFYLQADEVLHEKDYPVILESSKKYMNHKKVQGLIFKYIHFFGSYDYVGNSRRWFPYEVRMIRPNQGIYSYRDAQGFRNKKDIKLLVKNSGACVYHYGWVRHPQKQLEKLNSFYGLWNGEEYVVPEVKSEEQFDFAANADAIFRFTGSHPAVMQKRITEKNWDMQLDTNKKQFSFKDRVLNRLEKMTGKQLFRFRNYTKL
ncbi:MAG: glycosyltransferase family 2 protein [Sphingobacteriales bacterium]|nr:glycosyltransferase family 2 protein [Sphingobacteriales bacterium]